MSDIVTVTSGTYTAGVTGAEGSVAADLVTYLSAKLLEVAETVTILDQFGEKVPLPSNSSKTVRFPRQEKFSVSTTQLTEGISPDADGITMIAYEATVEQYGRVVRISDLAELTARHDMIQRTVYLLGLQLAETYDQLLFNVLDAATSIYRPNNKAADTSLTAADQVGFVDLVNVAAILQDNGGRTMDDGNYVLVTPPQVHAGMLKDPDFKASVQFAAPDRIWRGEVNQLGGFRIVRTNAPGFAATAQAGAGQASKVYSSFGIAKFAYQITDLQNARMYTAAPGGLTDTLQQSRKVGWKFAYKSIITNQNWIERVRSAGANSVTNP